MGIGTFVNQHARHAETSTRRVQAPTGDLILVVIIIALGIFGLLMLYSASPDFSQKTYGSATRIFNKQLIFMVIGVLAAFFLSRIDYHFWRKIAIISAASIVILTLISFFVNSIK